MATVLEFRGITKMFPGVIANNDISFEIQEGNVHGLLGENGSGKSTLMKVLFGLYRPDKGDIYIHGERVDIQSARDAFDVGIGMVHQHFMLIPVFSAVENLILGFEPRKGLSLDMAKAIRETNRLSQEYGLYVEPLELVRNLSVCQQQRIEILKALSHEVKILILDEPTGVLTPQEIDELYKIIRHLRKSGCSIIFISHKLNEVLTITDWVTVLRAGKVIGTVKTTETNEHELARMMVGREVLMRVEKEDKQIGPKVLSVEGLCCQNNMGLPAVHNVAFEIHEGEIVGIAAIDGNGRKELVEVLTGLRKAKAGEIRFNGEDVTNLSSEVLHKKGLAHIPEDRQRHGLLMDADLVENAILGYENNPAFGKSPFLILERIKRFARKIIETFDVRTPSEDVLGRTLSGGNQQKLIIGRELSQEPKLLIAAEPTRGLDIGATEFVHQTLIQQAKKKSTGILLCSSDLDEIMTLSDRILVLHVGMIVGNYLSGMVTKEDLGLAMAGGQCIDAEPTSLSDNL